MNSTKDQYGWRTFENGDSQWECDKCGRIIGATLRGKRPYLAVTIHRSRCGRI